MTEILQTLKQRYNNFFYPTEDKKFHFFIMDNFRAIVFALVVAMFIRTFFFEPFKIPSTSMVPTLRIGDFLFISKWDYGTKIPFTDKILNQKPIQVGDVIVFDKDIQNTGSTTTYIKRVVGSSGDKIAFKYDRVILNGEVQNQIYRGRLVYEDKQGDVTGLENEEYLGKIKHSVLEDNEINVANLKEITIPEGYIAVMGDNRDHSYDSRFWRRPNWGLVKVSEVRGKARIIFFSWNRNLKPRFDRFLTSLVPEKQ